MELQARAADLEFLKLVLELEQRTGQMLPVDSLQALSCLRNERRADVATIAGAIQRDVTAARVVLERLVEAGIVQAHGVKKGRTYTLSAAVYRSLGDPTGYERQAGFEPLQQAEMVKRWVLEHGEIRRADVMDLCQIGQGQAARLLRKLVDEGALKLHGTRRGAFTTRGPNALYFKYMFGQQQSHSRLSNAPRAPAQPARRPTRSGPPGSPIEPQGQQNAGFAAAPETSRATVTLMVDINPWDRGESPKGRRVTDARSQHPATPR